MVMHENKKMDKRFHIVDLDPYGSPSHFLDAAVQCVDDEGFISSLLEQNESKRKF